MNKKIIWLIVILFIAIAAINAEYLISTLKSQIIRSSVDDTPGNAPPETYPLILFHGFNPIYSQRISELSMKDMQHSLATDLNYDDKGIFTSKTTCAELRYSTKPIIIRATYLEKLDLTEIDEYAKNIDLIISKIKHCTGSSKVDVVTHSMGGIVVRYYVKNIDSSSIRKAIMMGAPNRGGFYNLGEIAEYFVDNGESRIRLDFIQLSEDHNFMKELNKEDQTIDIEYYTIAGDIDGKGDGVVLSESVPLQSAENIVVPCNHVLLKHPSLCPEAYEFIQESLLS